MARKITLIVARAINGCIGVDSDVPWAIREDLRRFKRLTMGKNGGGTPMIMGRKTFESLPGVLPRRRHIVITRDQNWSAKGAEVVHSPEEALELAGNGDISVIGGGEIYSLFMPHATHLEITEIYENTQGDTFMATPGREWVKTASRKCAAWGNDPAYAFVSLERHGNEGSGG